MVCLHSSIAACDSIPQSPTMSGSSDRALRPRQINHLPRNRRAPNSSNPPSCTPSQSAAIDILILIAVIGAFGFLLYPYVRFTYLKVGEIGVEVMPMVIEEVLENPLIYGSVGLSMACVTAVAWAIVVCMSPKCGNPRCQGLQNAAEFDIQLETEDSVKSCCKTFVKNGVKKGLFELPWDHHRELEAELKKMAPPNGRAILVFKARCGCSVGRMEVPGPRRPRKIKK